jgi:hypothetical protein
LIEFVGVYYRPAKLPSFKISRRRWMLKDESLLLAFYGIAHRVVANIAFSELLTGLDLN